MDSALKFICWRVLILTGLSILLGALRAAPPANDGYSNRFAIVNSPLVVTTSLAEATSEYYPEFRESYTEYGYGFPQGIGSLWWTVTLTNPSSLTIEFLEYSDAERVDVWRYSWYAYGGYWAGGVWAGRSAIGCKAAFATARLTNGGPVNLDVQIVGKAPRVVFRFTIHTAPLILTPPANRTANPGESVFFGVNATGHSALQYQWLHNGEPLAGENFPMLSLDGVTGTNAGTYRVVVWDDLGTNSAEATLTVTETNAPIRWAKLERVSTNDWRALLEAEAGRSYQIETSGNLTNWAPLTGLVQESDVRFFGALQAVASNGVVFLPNTNSEVRFTTPSAHQFFRAARYQAANSECHNNLKKIRFAKELWMIANRKIATDRPMDSELFGSSRFLATKPQCPHNGVYALGVNYAQPACSVHPPLLEPNW